MLFKSKQKVNGTPVWEVDTDTQTVRHCNPKTGETERYVFHTDHIRYDMLIKYIPAPLRYGYTNLESIGSKVTILHDLDLSLSVVCSIISDRIKALAES